VFKSHITIHVVFLFVLALLLFPNKQLEVAEKKGHRKKGSFEKRLIGIATYCFPTETN